VLPTRHDSMEVRMASCVLASLLAIMLAEPGKGELAPSSLAPDTGTRAAA